MLFLCSHIILFMFPLWLSTLCIIAINYWFVCFLHWPEYTKSPSTLCSQQLAHSSRHGNMYWINTSLLPFIEHLQSHPHSLNPRHTMSSVDTHNFSLFYKRGLKHRSLFKRTRGVVARGCEGGLPLEPTLSTTPRGLETPSEHSTYTSSCFFKMNSCSTL